MLPHLEDLSWKVENRTESLEKVFQYVRGIANYFLTWYDDKAKVQRKWGRSLRSSAILATIVAGLIPLLAQIFSENGTIAIAPGWASVALVIAGALVMFDHFFGFSSAWMRFRTTHFQIHTLLQAFLLEWETKQAEIKGQAVSDHQLHEGLNRCKAFLDRVNSLLEAEMDAWKQEFQNALKEIDKSTQLKSKTMNVGGLSVTVLNGDQSETGWELSLDDGTPQQYAGKTAAFKDLVPGVHAIRIEGKINGTMVHSQKAVSVPAGGVTPVELEMV